MREAVHRERHEEGTDRIMVEEAAIGLSGGAMQALQMAHPARVRAPIIRTAHTNM